MKNRLQAGSAHIVIIIIIIVVVLGGLGFVFWQNFMGKTATSTTTTTQPVDPQQSKLEDIKIALNTLNHRIDTVGASTGMDLKFDQPNSLLTVNNYEVNVIFNGSIYATNATLAPVGSTDGKAGSGQAQALDKVAVNKILTENGLSLDSSETVLVGQTLDHYSSKLVRCNVFDTEGISSVRCTSQDEATAALTAATAAYAALSTKYSDAKTASYQQMTLYKSSDASVLGVFIDNIDGIPSILNAYLVKVGSAPWQYVGSTAVGAGGSQASCGVINKPEYKNVFDITSCK